MEVHIGATWQIRLSRACAAAVRPETVFSVVADMRCMSPPVVDNATVTSDVTARSMTINCYHGYRISGGVYQGYVTATFHCNNYNAWGSISPCTRTLYTSSAAVSSLTWPSHVTNLSLNSVCQKDVSVFLMFLIFVYCILLVGCHLA